MRTLALALLAVAVSAPGVIAIEQKQPDVELLLDLDLLHESDPRAQREESVVRNVRLLELLERLSQPAAARRGGDSRPAPKGAC